MKIIRTALEWHKTKPNAYIANNKLQKGVCVRIQEYSKDGINCTYESITPDGGPLIYFGNKCPYIVSGKINYVVHVVCGLSGGITALDTNLAKDLNWYEVDPIKYYENSQD